MSGYRPVDTYLTSWSDNSSPAYVDRSDVNPADYILDSYYKTTPQTTSTGYVQCLIITIIKCIGPISTLIETGALVQP